MSARRTVVRLLAVVVALLQTGGAPAIALADALLARSAAPASVVHVEDATRDQCAPSHDADCGLCRALALGGHAPAAHTASAPSGHDLSTRAEVQNGGRGRLPTQLLPRAPPADRHRAA